MPESLRIHHIDSRRPYDSLFAILGIHKGQRTLSILLRIPIAASVRAEQLGLGGTTDHGEGIEGTERQ